MLRMIETRDQALHFLMVAHRHVGVDVNGSFLLVGQRGLQDFLPRLESVSLVADHDWIDAVLDGFDDLLD